MEILDFARIAASGFIGATITPAIMGVWSKMSPPSEIKSSEKYTYDQLSKRNSRINAVASVLSVSGMLLVIPLYYFGISKNNPWPLGLGFGLMVVLPVAYISMVTLSSGLGRFLEFWRYYELEYEISIRSLLVVYALLSILGFVSAYQLIVGGIH